MKTYNIVKHRSDLLNIDWETKEITNIPYSNGNRDWQWFIEEDGVVEYTDVNSDCKFSKEVKKGDLVVLLYWPNDERRIVVVPAQDWYNMNKESDDLRAVLEDGKRMEKCVDCSDYCEPVSC